MDNRRLTSEEWISIMQSELNQPSMTASYWCEDNCAEESRGNDVSVRVFTEEAFPRNDEIMQHDFYCQDCTALDWKMKRALWENYKASSKGFQGPFEILHFVGKIFNTTTHAREFLRATVYPKFVNILVMMGISFCFDWSEISQTSNLWTTCSTDQEKKESKPHSFILFTLTFEEFEEMQHFRNLEP